MKKYGVGILLLLTAIAWFLVYRGHFFYWEGAGLFLTSGEYWSKYALQHGGWGEYAGNFMALFFRWKWIGSIWMALMDFCCFLSVYGIARSVGLRKQAVWVAALGMGLLIALQCNLYFTQAYALQLVGIPALFYGYLRVRRPGCRVLLFSLAAPLLFFILLPAQGGILYLALILSEWTVRPKRERISVWAMLGWCIFWAVLPLCWRQVVLIPEWMTYAFSDVFRSTLRQRYLMIGLAAFPILLQVWGATAAKSRVGSAVMIALGAIGIGWILVMAFQGSLERRLRMLEAIQAGEWERVERLAAGAGETDEEFLYLTTLADAKQGKLPDRLFGYPCWNTGALWMPRNLDYFSNLCGAALFQELGILNEALVRFFQAAETTPWSADLMTLRGMILLNMEMGNSVLTEKYLEIMQHVPFYGKWVQARKQELKSGARIDPDYWLQAKPDFFVSGKGFLLNMENIVKADPENRIAWDYLLCGLLIQKNIPRFYDYFVQSPYNTMQNLPKAYEEALLIHAAQRREKPAYPVSDERKQLLLEYQEYYQRYKDKEHPETYFPEKFRNTLWYYFHFTDIRKPAPDKDKIRESVYKFPET